MKLERLEEAHQRGIRHVQLVHYTPTTNNEDIMLTAINPTPNRGGRLPRPPPMTTA
jgi:hypothetical protein